MKQLCILTFFSLLALPVLAQKKTTWVIDKEHARIAFSVNHILISETAGIFKGFEGTVTTSNTDFTDSEIHATIDVNTIDTDSKKRDDDLKSDKFFDAEKFQKIIFRSTSFKKTEGNNYKLTGELTIKGVTRTVAFDVVYGGTVEKDRWGKTQAGFKLTGSINRFDYGLNWNDQLDNGSPVAGAKVNIIITVELTKVN